MAGTSPFGDSTSFQGGHLQRFSGEFSTGLGTRKQADNNKVITAVGFFPSWDGVCGALQGWPGWVLLQPAACAMEGGSAGALPAVTLCHQPRVHDKYLESCWKPSRWRAELSGVSKSFQPRLIRRLQLRGCL